MGLIVFPFKHEDLDVIGANLALAAGHPAVHEVWAVAAAEGTTMDRVAELTRQIDGAPIRVFPQERLGNLRPGKGDGMNTALRNAAERGFDRVHFYDADITNFGGHWIEGAEAAADRGYHIVRHRFPRAATDAMITWMITRPLLAIFFPGTALPRIGQPLGGAMLLSQQAVEALANDPLVVGRSDWGIDTIITFASLATGLPVYEHHLADGKRHALYGSLGEIRTMLVECLDAAITLEDRPTPNGWFDRDPDAPVPADLKRVTGFDMDRTVPLLTEGWTEAELALVNGLPADTAARVRANVTAPEYDFMDAAVWGEVLGHLVSGFRLGDPAWESLAFRLWVMRVLAYATGPATEGYDRAISYLEETVGAYERG